MHGIGSGREEEETIPSRIVKKQIPRLRQRRLLLPLRQRRAPSRHPQGLLPHLQQHLYSEHQWRRPRRGHNRGGCGRRGHRGCRHPRSAPMRRALLCCPHSMGTFGSSLLTLFVAVQGIVGIRVFTFAACCTQPVQSYNAVRWLHSHIHFFQILIAEDSDDQECIPALSQCNDHSITSQQAF
jgi:hypothetical protein